MYGYTATAAANSFQQQRRALRGLLRNKARNQYDSYRHTDGVRLPTTQRHAATGIRTSEILAGQKIGNPPHKPLKVLKPAGSFARGLGDDGIFYCSMVTDFLSRHTTPCRIGLTNILLNYCVGTNPDVVSNGYVSNDC